MSETNGTAMAPTVIFTDTMNTVRQCKRALESVAKKESAYSDRMKQLARRAYGEINNVLAEYVSEQIA